MKVPTKNPSDRKTMAATTAAIKNCVLFSKECHLKPNLSARLGFSLLSIDDGCQRSSRIGSKKIVKRNASTTPMADMMAKTLIGSRLDRC